jgi:hypothetical protein
MTEGTKDIRGVDQKPQGREPRQLGRKEVAGSTTETIQESKYGCGLPRHGTNVANVQRGGSAGYNDKSSEAHRASLCDSRK